MLPARPSESLAADERERQLATNGQAIGIVGLFGSLIVGVLLFLFFQEFLTVILDMAAEDATDPQVQEGNDWLQTLLENIPFIFAMISVFGMIALAVYQSRF